MATQTVQFYTTGEGFTNLMRNFFEEGRFKAVYETLEDGGLPHDQIVEFFYGRGYFEGDSRDEDGLRYYTKPIELDQESRFYWAMRNFMSNQKNEMSDDWDDDDYFERLKYPKLSDALMQRAWEENEELQYLRKVVTRETLHGMLWKRALEEEGWKLNPDPKENEIGAVILQSGDVIVCPYNCHRDLYPVLYKLGLATAPDWVEDRNCIHVSSGSLGGKPTSVLNHPNLREEYIPGISLAQIVTLIKYKEVFKGIYADRDRLFECLRQYFGEIENHGGKYNNLIFLRTCYPHLKLPRFGKEPISNAKWCIRTSPKYSIPGLLHSRFNVKEDDNIFNVIAEMLNEFLPYKDLRQDNEFNIFFQEFIEGTNGVCHRSRDGFSYAIGDEQGDVVAGKTANKRLPRHVETSLRKIADEIFVDMEVSFQLEFVVTPNDEVYIVQFRKLENEHERTVIGRVPTGVIVKGRTFSKGELDNLTEEDVLIVEEDADSKALIGKKALIVKSNVEFSHILALSKALRIPSIYATGNFKLPKGKFKMTAFNSDGYIHQ